VDCLKLRYTFEEIQIFSNSEPILILNFITFIEFIKERLDWDYKHRLTSRAARDANSLC